MIPINKLKGISPDEAQLLASKGIDSVEQLWISVGKGEAEIERIATVFGEKKRLIELLTEDGLDQSSTIGDSRIARYWLDLVIIIALIVLTLLIMRAASAYQLRNAMLSNDKTIHLTREGTGYV
jgi:hypothetical protein